MHDNLEMFPEAIRVHMRSIDKTFYDRIVSFNKFCEKQLLEIKEFEKALFSGSFENNFTSVYARNNKRKLDSSSENDFKKLRSSIDKLSPVPEVRSCSPDVNILSQNSQDVILQKDDASQFDEYSNFTNDHKDNRPKRSASKKAVEIISKQMNQNLISKLRRPKGSSSTDECDETEYRTARSTIENCLESEESNVETSLNVKKAGNKSTDHEDHSAETRRSRRTTRKRSTASTTKQEPLSDDREIMPPPPVPVLGRPKRTKKARSTQVLTTNGSVSDNEGSSPSKKRSTRNSKQSLDVASQNTIHMSNICADIKHEAAHMKCDVENLEAHNTKGKGSKTTRRDRSQSNSSEKVDGSDSKTEQNDINIEIEEQMLILKEVRPKRTKARKNQHVENQEPTYKDVDNLSVGAEAQSKKTSDQEISLVDKFSHVKTENEEQVLTVKEARPKRTKARKNQHVENQEDKDADNMPGVVEAQTEKVLDPEISLDKKLSYLKTENKEEVLTQKEVRAKRTKARKLQKQQHLDTEETTAQEQVVPKNAEEKHPLQSQPDNNMEPDLTTASSRPKRTVKLNRKYQTSESEENREATKGKDEPVIVKTAPQVSNDVKDSARDPSLISSAADTTDGKLQFNAVVILDKCQKQDSQPEGKSEQHPSDKTFRIDHNHHKALDETIILSSHTSHKVDVKPSNLNQTVVIKPAQEPNRDSGLLTDDNSEVDETPPKLYSHNIKVPTKLSKAINLGTSPVKQRVEQFERMAADNKAAAAANLVQANTNISSANTRNKTKAMASNTEIPVSNKRTRSNIITNIQSFVPNVSAKVTGTLLTAGEEARRRNERELEAFKKKDAILEAKRQDQKLKREAKAAAAAAARSAAAKEREQAAEDARIRQEKIKQTGTAQRSEQRAQAANKKRIEQERKALELEEKRKQEEAARLQELEKAAEDRLRHLEEERRRKEALAEEKKMQAIRNEFIAKQNEEKRLLALQYPKSKSKATTPLKCSAPALAPAVTPLKVKNTNKIMTVNAVPAPTVTSDGFEYLTLDDNKSLPPRQVPSWSRSEQRNYQLQLQRYIKPSVVDKLFMVQHHNPRLDEIFPNIDQKLLKRTSSAIWKTPPRYSMMPQKY